METEIINNHETRIALSEQKVLNLQKDIMEIKSAVVGNGKIGLKTRVDRLEVKFYTIVVAAFSTGGVIGYVIQGLL